ncbi:LuxR family transcriptional regulator [Actinomadura sp. KC216]|uniref:ATP-binding protein n=1 Tax=Actinomadura sp. KC216 TaxID=2530370 RepID=UPI00104E7943|nr:LuxR family transcriptional regulator [Actinomadura sp. KC216]TDB89856.1 LuxR family transcriptional regulator [Actinomadura sp. KC216]
MEEPFVGRRRELAELERAGAEASEGRGSVVLVGGAAGVGKSALVGRAVSRLGDAVVLTGRAAREEGAPDFWPWSQLMESRAALGLGLRVLTPPGQDAASLRFEAIDRAVRDLAEAAERQPLVLVLEDLDWADEASLRLLRHLAGEARHTRIVLFGTCRTVPDLLAEVASTALGPLGEGDVAEYLSRFAEAHPSWALRLHRESGGNALFLRELTRTLPGRLAGPAPDRLPVPSALRRLIEVRGAGLGEACRALLAGCAVYGDQIDVDVLRPDPEPVAEAVAAGILVEDPRRPGSLSWSHGLVRTAWYDRLPRNERLAWHRRIARAHSDLHAAASHWTRAAVDPEDRRAAAEACSRAAERDERRSSFDSACYWHGQALAFAADDTERCRRLLGLAEAAYRAGRIAEALEACETAAGLAEQLADPASLAKAAITVEGVGGPQAGTVGRLCARALKAPLDDATRARVLAQQAVSMAVSDDPETGPVSARALALAEGSGDLDAVVAALHARHQAAGGPDGVAERLAVGARLGSLSQDRPTAALWGHTWRIDAAFQLGAIPAVEAETRGLADLAARPGGLLARWHLLRTQASLALLTGRLNEAADLARAFEEIGEHTGDVSAQGAAFVFATYLERRTGEQGRAQPPAAYATVIHQVPILMAVTAMLHLEREEPDEAAVLFERLRSRLDDLPVNQRWTGIVTAVSELAAALDDQETAERCLLMLRPYKGYYDNQAAGCGGSIARTLGVLATCLRRFDDAEQHLTAAARMERRTSALPTLALTELAHARLLRARSAERARALTLAEQAARTARRLGMARVAREASALADELSGVSGAAALTGREREVAGLVAAGLANREIAGRLHLSERTVETHIRNALAKLSLANRTQLTAWALRNGIRG